MKWQITLILLIILPIASAASIMPVKCDASSVGPGFQAGEDVCVYGTGFDPGAEVDLYVINDQENYTQGQALNDLSGDVERVQTTNKGILVLKKIWSALVDGVYDFVADINLNGNYDQGDVVNAGNMIVQEESEDLKDPEDDIEEVPEFSVIASAIVLIGAGIIIHKKRKEEAK